MADPTTPAPSQPDNTLTPEFVAILRCPHTRSRLTLDGQWLVSEEGLRYPIRDGIPVLLPEEAALPPGANSLAEVKAKRG